MEMAPVAEPGCRDRGERRPVATLLADRAHGMAEEHMPIGRSERIGHAE